MVTDATYREFLPSRFPLWPGLVVGSVVAVGLGLAALAGSPVLEAFRPNRLDGAVMTVAMGLVAFSLVTLAGEWTGLLAKARSLRQLGTEPVEDLRQLAESSDVWALHGLRDALRLVPPQRYAKQELRAALAATRDIHHTWLSERWLFHQALIVTLPVLGFVAGVWNVRVHGNGLRFGETFLPVIIMILATAPVMLLTTLVSRGGKHLFRQWEWRMQLLAGLTPRLPAGVAATPPTVTWPTVHPRPPQPSPIGADEISPSPDQKTKAVMIGGTTPGPSPHFDDEDADMEYLNAENHKMSARPPSSAPAPPPGPARTDRPAPPPAAGPASLAGPDEDEVEEYLR
jgi:hypothetical protein